MDLALSKKHVLITGASKGIGLAIAKGFAAEGANLTLVARSQIDLDQAAQTLQTVFHVHVKTIAADLSEPKSVERLLNAAADTDILVNNAGAIPGGDIEKIDEVAWRMAWELKVFGYINMTRAFYQHMKQRETGGVIINITGAGGSRMIYDYVAGSAGNASLEAFSRTVGSYSLDHGVRVLAISPGAIQTERVETLLKHSAKTQFNDEKKWPQLLKNMPQERAGLPEEVANLTVFLASDKASYISGSVHLVDGGYASRHGFFN